jgi:hypothetical protein
MFSCALLAALIAMSCVSESELGAVDGVPDAGPGAILDAALPQADATGDAAGDAAIDAESDVDAGAPDAYVLPENSIRSCAEFLSCMSNCPPEVGSCVGPCHDAMTEQAAADVQAFLNCASQNHCRDQDCIMRKCGAEMQICSR